MKRQILSSKAQPLIRGGLLLCILAVILWGCFLPADVTIYHPESFQLLDCDWSQTLDDRTFSLKTLADCHEPNLEDALVLTRQITTEMADQCLLFYAEHQTVEIYSNQELLYQLTCPQEMTTFGSPGRSWVKVPISQDFIGQTLTIKLQSNFPLFHTAPAEIYNVPEPVIYDIQVHFLSLRNTLALALLVLALVSYFHGFLWKQRKMRHFLFAMADVYLFVGLWLCAEVNVLAIWLGRAPLSALLAQIFTRVIPVVCYHLFRLTLPYTSWRTRLMALLVWSNCIISLLLQLIFGISLLQLALFHIAVVAFISVLGFLEIYLCHRSGLAPYPFPFAPLLHSLLLVGALAECYIYLHSPTAGQWMGLPLCFSCLIHFLLTHIILIGKHATMAQEQQRLEKAFVDLQKNPLNQQINAHFLYNSLNTIAAFCKTDAQMAYEAIRLVGQYMRAYTYLVGANDYVPLEDELDLMQTYMAIQNMRFDNSLSLAIRNGCDGVMLPPLSLQPIIENAVNHGIRKGERPGEIQIHAGYRYNMAEITITDNGVGFDVDQLDSVRGVGLRNLDSRIRAMGGRMSVESVNGQGTTVTLLVPIFTDETGGLP